MFYIRLLIELSIILLLLCQSCRSLQNQSHAEGSIRVNKCCEPFELLIDLRCVDANKTEQGMCVIISGVKLELDCILKINKIHNSLRRCLGAHIHRI